MLFNLLLIIMSLLFQLYEKLQLVLLSNLRIIPRQLKIIFVQSLSCYTNFMQPNQDPTDWQQPTEQPSQAPYVAEPDESQPEPRVTLRPDEARTSESNGTSSEEFIDNPGAGTSEQQPVRWQATEYIHHDKTALWFVVFSIVVIVFILIAIFLIKSITFAVLVPVMAAALVVYSYRPPRVIDYTLSRQGLHINDRLYSFGEFKSFGVIRDDGEYSIMLIPIKRFRPGVTVYFPEEVGEAIVDMLGVRLPMQELKLDVVDKLTRKLRM